MKKGKTDERRRLAKGGIEVPPDVLRSYSKEDRERFNIHTGAHVWDEIPEGALITPARRGKSDGD